MTAGTIIRETLGCIAFWALFFGVIVIGQGILDQLSFMKRINSRRERGKE